MDELDFVPVTGYSVAYCIDCGDGWEVLETPILGIYVARHAFAVEALSHTGEVIELHSLCVLKLPNGKYAHVDYVFDEEGEWLDWVSTLECDDVCAECREKERIERDEAFRSNGS